MKYFFTLMLVMLTTMLVSAQNFDRTELPTPLSVPWEILYGPDGFLYLTESGGRVSRVNPDNGIKTVVYIAPDFFEGSPLEQHDLCFQPEIGSGTLGLDLHPDFMENNTSFIYFVYSYNSGTDEVPETKFKIVRLLWNPVSNMVTGATDLVTGISTGHDHLGGRLMAIKRDGISYLYLTVGDHGISETNDPDCYDPQSENPNNFAQDPDFDNGKVHRYNIDGSIPADNPIPGNSFYTRGHRNPQGLIYNHNEDILYDTEHGDRTDDEINILEKGMNYGWKDVRGYHDDNNFPGELDYIDNYVPHAEIANDMLVPPLYSWCAQPQPDSDEYLEWCTVAPSGGEYYDSFAIPQWTNSLLVVTLKNGTLTDQELYMIRLNADGVTLAPSTTDNPNPKQYFGEDQVMNGRLRDLAVSPDGTKIFLINNFGDVPDHITVYTYDDETSVTNVDGEIDVQLYPNPAQNLLVFDTKENIMRIAVNNMPGKQLMVETGDIRELDVSSLAAGTYFIRIETESGQSVYRKFWKQ